MNPPRINHLAVGTTVAQVRYLLLALQVLATLSARAYAAIFVEGGAYAGIRPGVPVGRVQRIIDPQAEVRRKIFGLWFWWTPVSSNVQMRTSATYSEKGYIV